MNNLAGLLIAVILTLIFVRRYLKGQEALEARSREAAQKGSLRSDGPQSQHPHIDTTYCIGCATCTMVCPEGDVLAMLAGQAVIVNGYKCIGHSLCADACPVGAITMVMASPSMGADQERREPGTRLHRYNRGENPRVARGRTGAGRSRCADRGRGSRRD